MTKSRNGKAIVKTDAAFYAQVRDVFVEARQFVHKTANFAMVKAYWLVGKMIVEKQGGEAKAAYGDRLIDELSVRLTQDLGAGFTRVNLFYMRRFYLAFQNVHTLCEQLSWSHYRPRPLHAAFAQQANLRRKVQAASAERTGADRRASPRTHGNRRRATSYETGRRRDQTYQEVRIRQVYGGQVGV